MARHLCLCALLLLAVTVQQGTARQQTFRVVSDNVPVFVTVTDKSGALVPNLTRADFQVFDNGKPQPLTLFDNSSQPIRLIVLIDISGSMMRNLPLLREACTELFASLGPDDLARMGTFGETIDISPVFTRDAAALLSAIPAAIPPDMPTPLWNAIDKAIGEFGSAPGRPVVLVMSDSKDSGPRFRQKILTQLDISDRAEREDVMIYGIGVQSRGPMGGGGNLMGTLVSAIPDPGLGTVAIDSGGGYFEIRPRDDLHAAFARVVDELHHQYLLGFSPPTRDGKTHKIEVKAVPKDLKLRARKTYRAPAK